MISCAFMSPPTDVPEGWRPPSPARLSVARTLLEPWRRLTAPRFIGTELVPRDRPVMFICNHTLMGVIDTPLLMLGIYDHTGHYPRSLGDHFHFKVPGWRDLLIAYGTVHGSRDNCRAIMGAGDSLLIFPGGGREVLKHRGEEYQLVWGQRAGFARLAREFGYPIIPVASVGAEECYTIVVDQNDVLASPLGPTIAKHSPRTDIIFPTIARGFAGTFLPVPQQFYFQFGEPIDSTDFPGDDDDDAAIFALREAVRVRLTALLAELLELRASEPAEPVVARFRRLFTRG